MLHFINFRASRAVYTEQAKKKKNNLLSPKETRGAKTVFDTGAKNFRSGTAYIRTYL